MTSTSTTPPSPTPSSPPSLALPPLDPAEIQPHLAEMVARDGWSRDDLLDLQRQRCADALRAAASASPYYRETIGAAVADGACLADLPALTKRTLMDNWDRVVTDPRLRLRDVEAHLDGDRAGTLILDEYRAYATGGTTGERAVVVYDRPGWIQTMANMLRLLGWVGVGPTTRTVGIGAPTPLHITNRAFAELRGGRSGAPPLSVLTPLPEMVAALNAYQPEVVFTYPTVVARLVEEQQAGRLAIRPSRLVTAAETLTAHIRQNVRDAFDAPVLDAYGTTEAGLLGSECDHGQGIHLAEDLVLVEPVDDANRPVPVGTPGAKVLVTTLFPTPLPLIRYEISDVVTLTDDPCPCGRPFARVASLDGRREEILTLRGRDGGEVRLRAMRLRAALDGVPGLRQFQLVPSGPEALLVRVTVREGADADTIAAGVRTILDRVLEAAGVQLATLDVTVVDAIERHGTGAKQLLVGRSPGA